MEECVLTFVNTSRVYQAEKALRSAGHAVGLRPLPPGVESRCGLCVRGTYAEIEAYYHTLGEAQKPEAVYRSPAVQGKNWTRVDAVAAA